MPGNGKDVMKTLKKNVSLRESSQEETNLKGGAIPKAEMRLIGKVGLVAHLMAEKLAGLPKPETVPRCWTSREISIRKIKTSSSFR